MTNIELEQLNRTLTYLGFVNSHYIEAKNNQDFRRNEFKYNYYFHSYMFGHLHFVDSLINKYVILEKERKYSLDKIHEELIRFVWSPKRFHI
jgi:hypothetical protein